MKMKRYLEFINEKINENFRSEKLEKFMEVNDIGTGDGWDDAFITWDRDFLPEYIYITDSEDHAEDFGSVIVDGMYISIYKEKKTRKEKTDYICVAFDEWTEEMVAFYVNHANDYEVVDGLDIKCLKLDNSNIPHKSKLDDENIDYSDVYQNRLTGDDFK